MIRAAAGQTTRCAIALFVLASSLAHAQGDVETAFAAFWKAESPEQAQRAVQAVIDSGVDFEEAYARLRRGRTYGPEVPRGIVKLTHTVAGREFVYSVQVPDNYDPSRAYQARVHLHGGVLGRTDGAIRGTGGIGALDGAEQFYILPVSWSEAPWWTSVQLANIRAILDTVKRTWNIDENRVALAGVSDGGTAAWYFAMRDTTPFASFASLNGALVVLQSPGIGLDGGLFPQNLVNKPWFVVNGGRDRLYPIDLVKPYVDHFAKSGVDLMFRPRPEGEHNTAWWPEERDGFESFVRSHPRAPFPDRVSWSSDLGGGETNRSHWLVVTRLMGEPDPRSPLPDANVFDDGVRDDLRIPPRPLFSSWRPWGRVDLVRDGNTIIATSRGVAEFTLLLSPDVFDFSQPITVIADGDTVFSGRLEKNLATLMKWAAKDNDRTMLFGAELRIEPSAGLQTPN